MVRGLELPPALVRAYAVENFFDVALVVGTEKLPGAWVDVGVGYVRKALFAAPEVARKLGAGPVDPKRIAELPFVTPIYNVNGQFVPADDGCPLGAQRSAGSATSRRRSSSGSTWRARPASSSSARRSRPHAHVARGELAEVRVRGWDVREPLTLAVNGERVRSRTQKTLAALVARTLDRARYAERHEHSARTRRRRPAPRADGRTGASRSRPAPCVAG